MRKEHTKAGIQMARQFHHQNNYTARSELKVKKNQNEEMINTFRNNHLKEKQK
jgi:hypothetical protein